MFHLKLVLVLAIFSPLVAKGESALLVPPAYSMTQKLALMGVMSSTQKAGEQKKSCDKGEQQSCKKATAEMKQTLAFLLVGGMASAALATAIATAASAGDSSSPAPAPVQTPAPAPSPPTIQLVTRDQLRAAIRAQ